MRKSKGRVTVPVEEGCFEQVKELCERLSADALRDCDGTALSEEFKGMGLRRYATWFVSRGHGTFAAAHPKEQQRVYLMSERVLCTDGTVRVPLTDGYFERQICPDDSDPARLWQVTDRTNGEHVPCGCWHYERESGAVIVENATPFHEYTVSFLAVVKWDPTHMYNTLTNAWEDVPPDVPFDVRYAASWTYMKAALTAFLERERDVDVVRFTTFFYHFFLVFSEDATERLVDWFGYGAAISEKALEAFEVEHGYSLTPEALVDEGYYHTPFRLPTRAQLDFMQTVRRLCAERAAQLVAIVHGAGKEAMMFLGDTWIGVEPYGEEFPSIGLDAVVGSVGNGTTCRMLAEIEGVSYHEGRLLPYFFPDTFYEGNEPSLEAMRVWLAARRALLRKPLERIGFGGYPSLACRFPRFVDCAARITQEFRDIADTVGGHKPLALLRVGILNAWGRLRAWQTHMVAHALPYREPEPYSGVEEALSGMAVEVVYFSFEDIRRNGIPREVDVILNVGAAGTAFSGGEEWRDPAVIAAVRRFVYEGGGFVGVGDPSATEYGGRFFQLGDVLGVERERGFTLSRTRRAPTAQREHFITADGALSTPRDGYIYKTADTCEVAGVCDGSITLAANAYGSGRGVYLAGCPYSHRNTRLLLRALCYAAHRETLLHRGFSQNPYCEAHYYPTLHKTAVINNTHVPQHTLVYDGAGKVHECRLAPTELAWVEDAP